MKGEERRKQLLKILSSSTGPVSGGTLSQELHVSRPDYCTGHFSPACQRFHYFFHKQGLSAPGREEIFQSL